MDIEAFVAHHLGSNIAAARHFALYGPAIGGLVFAACAGFDKSAVGGSTIWYLLIATFLSYLLGVVPAGLTGFCVGFFKPVSLSAGVGLSAAMGAVMMLASLVIVESVDKRSVAFNAGTLGFIALGAVAAAGAGLIYFGRALR